MGRAILIIFYLCFTSATWGVTVASWNVCNYLSMDRIVPGLGWRPNYPKPEAEKRALRETLLQLNADVLALQEMGPQAYLLELQADLKALGLHYPYIAWCAGQDPYRHLAVLSKIPFESHSFNEIPVNGATNVFIKRGFLFLKFASPIPWSLGVVHLKSSEFAKNAQGSEPGKAQREAEAAALMAWFSAHPQYTPDLLLGDFNDGPRSDTLNIFTANDLGFSDLNVKDAEGLSWTFSQKKTSFRSTLDHVLVNAKSLSGSNNFTVSQPYIYEADACLKASDHRLLCCQIH